MSSRAPVCASIALAVVVLPCLAAAQERTERELIELIVRDGPQAQAIRAGVEAVRREQAARLVLPNPAVAYSREGAGFTEFLQVEQTLPLFGVRAALSRAGVAATAAAEAERDARLWELRAAAARALARLAAEQDRLTAHEQSAGEVERLVAILRTRELEGEGSRFDRLRADQELRELRQTQTAAAIAVVDARAEVSQLLPRGVVLPRVIATPSRESAVAPDVEMLRTRAAASRAELRALASASRRAEAEGDAARRARRPSPTVMAGMKRADGAGDRETGGVAGVSVPLPLFDSGRLDSARWSAERVRIDAERAALERSVESEVDRATESLLLRRRALSGDEPPAAAELMRMAEVAYREGEAGILELLDAVRATSRARLRTIDIQLEVRLAEIALEQAVGEPLWP